MAFRFLLILSLAHLAQQRTKAQMLLPGITAVDYLYNDNSYGRYSTPQSVLVSPIYLRKDMEDAFSRIRSIKKEEENVVELSEDVFKTIGHLTDMSALNKVLGIEEDIETSFRQPLLRSEFDAFSPESKSTIDRYLHNPQQAHCAPESKAIDLGLTNTNELIYYPTCVRVNQCGGCCPNKDIISCQPVASEKVIVKVLELKTNNNENRISTPPPSRSRRRRNNIRVQYNTINVTVEEHTKCECLCKLRESDCNLEVHIYDEKSCACFCNNRDEEEKCYMSSNHIWKKETCKCLCRHEMPCSTGEKFDHSTCSCISLSLGLSLNNVLRKAQPGDQVYRQRKPTQALKFKII